MPKAKTKRKPSADALTVEHRLTRLETWLAVLVGLSAINSPWMVKIVALVQ